MPYLPRPEKKVVSGWSRTKPKKFYHSKAWKKVRQTHLLTVPVCEVCALSGTLNDATSGHPVDHIIRIEDGGAPLDYANLMTLCREHHAQKSAMERHGLTIEGVGEYGQLVPTDEAKQAIKKQLHENSRRREKS